MNHELQDRLMAGLERPHRLGMIGGELEEQLAHCASFSHVLGQIEGLPSQFHAVDLGTGGGLPGLALAAAWPDAVWTLVEMRSSRATEVELAALRLGLGNVEVLAEPAQSIGHGPFRHQVDVVVARAFGPPSLVAECACGVLAIGGTLIVSEPPNANPADRWPPSGLDAVGFGSARFMTHDAHQFALLQLERLPNASMPRRPPRADRGWPT